MASFTKKKGLCFFVLTLVLGIIVYFTFSNITLLNADSFSNFRTEKILPQDKINEEVNSTQWMTETIEGFENKQEFKEIRNIQIISKDYEEKVIKVIRNSEEFLLINVLSLRCEAKEAIDEIKNKASQGVQVRIIVDKMFTGLSADCLEILNQEKNIQVMRLGSMFKNKIHASFLLNDKRESVLGSGNLNEFSLKSHEVNHYGIEIGVYIEGQFVMNLYKEFFWLWGQEKKEVDNRFLSYIRTQRNEILHGQGCFLLKSDNRNEINTHDHVLSSLLDKFEGEIYITTPRLTGWEESHFLKNIKENMKKRKISILTNLIHSKNGELNMSLKDKVDRSNSKILKNIYSYFYNKLKEKAVKTSIENSRFFEKKSNVFGLERFIRGKLIFFDQELVSISTKVFGHEEVIDYSVVCRDKKVIDQAKSLVEELVNKSYKVLK